MRKDRKEDCFVVVKMHVGVFSNLLDRDCLPPTTIRRFRTWLGCRLVFGVTMSFHVDIIHAPGIHEPTRITLFSLPALVRLTVRNTLTRRVVRAPLLALKYAQYYWRAVDIDCAVIIVRVLVRMFEVSTSTSHGARGARRACCDSAFGGTSGWLALHPLTLLRLA